MVICRTEEQERVEGIYAIGSNHTGGGKLVIPKNWQRTEMHNRG